MLKFTSTAPWSRPETRERAAKAALDLLEVEGFDPVDVIAYRKQFEAIPLWHRTQRIEAKTDRRFWAYHRAMMAADKIALEDLPDLWTGSYITELEIA